MIDPGDQKRGSRRRPMDDAPSLFDPVASEAGKVEGMERAEENAPAEWVAAADAAVREAARLHREITTEIVWLLMPHELREVREPRALGAVMKRASAEKVIEDTGRVEKTSLKRAHRRPKAVWRSLIYKRPTY